MIQKIFSKDKTSVPREDCMEHFNEIYRKKCVIFSLIKEMAVLERNANPEDSALSILCEAYVYLMRMSEQISKLILDFEDKPMVKADSTEIAIYSAHHQGLKAFESELRYRFNLNLSSELDIN